MFYALRYFSGDRSQNNENFLRLLLYSSRIFFTSSFPDSFPPIRPFSLVHHLSCQSLPFYPVAPPPFHSLSTTFCPIFRLSSSSPYLIPTLPSPFVPISYPLYPTLIFLSRRPITYTPPLSLPTDVPFFPPVFPTFSLLSHSFLSPYPSSPTFISHYPTLPISPPLPRQPPPHTRSPWHTRTISVLWRE